MKPLWPPSLFLFLCLSFGDFGETRSTLTALRGKKLLRSWSPYFSEKRCQNSVHLLQLTTCWISFCFSTTIHLPHCVQYKKKWKIIILGLSEATDFSYSSSKMLVAPLKGNSAALPLVQCGCAAVLSPLPLPLSLSLPLPLAAAWPTSFVPCPLPCCAHCTGLLFVFCFADWEGLLQL